MLLHLSVKMGCEVAQCCTLIVVHWCVIYECHPLTHTVKAKRFEAFQDRMVILPPRRHCKHLISWQSATAVSLAPLPIKWFNPVAEDSLGPHTLIQGNPWSFPKPEHQVLSITEWKKLKVSFLSQSEPTPKRAKIGSCLSMTENGKSMLTALCYDNNSIMWVGQLLLIS